MAEPGLGRVRNGPWKAQSRPAPPGPARRSRRTVLLSGDEPPPRRLAPARELELRGVRGKRGDGRRAQWRAHALDHRQQLGFAAEFAEDDLEGLPRLAPGHELLVDEAHRVSAAEAALRVVAG